MKKKTVRLELKFIKLKIKNLFFLTKLSIVWDKKNQFQFKCHFKIWRIKQKKNKKTSSKFLNQTFFHLDIYLHILQQKITLKK